MSGYREGKYEKYISKLENEKRFAIKEYLNQYVIARRWQKSLAKRWEKLQRELYQPIGGIDYKETPSNSSGVVSQGAAALPVRLSDIECKIQEQRDEMAKALLEVYELIDYLPNKSQERYIVELRHIDGLEWDRINTYTHMTKTPCYDCYNRGLDLMHSYPRVQVILEQFITKRKKELLDCG